MKRHGLENLIMTARVKERKARGHQRLKYLNSLCEMWKYNVSSMQLITRL